MKQFLFITDFDGTLTAQDFFLQIMYRYQHEKAFFSEKKKGALLLSSVLEGANLEKDIFLKEIEYIPLDPSFKDFCEFVEKIGGEVLVLSAGSRYYIEKKLEIEGIRNVKIIANGGEFVNGKFKFIKNEKREFYSEDFGIDKEKVVLNLKDSYKKIGYAGDSYLDFGACRLADFKFAKKNLVKILNMLKFEFYEFENFKEIKEILINLLNI